MANYIVYKNIIKDNIKKLKKSFLDNDLDFQLFYSVKTNYCKPVLEVIKKSGSEYEILSNFEWNKVKQFKPKEIVLNGPTKNIDETINILQNVKALYFNIDNDTDIEILKKITNTNLKNKLKIGIRVYLNEEGVWNRFGYDINSEEFAKKIREIEKKFKLSGIHFHFSTNNFKITNYELLLSEIKKASDRLKIKLEFLDIGGGLPAANEFIYETDIYQRLPIIIKRLFPGIKIISEAGRNIVSNAIDIKAKVISLKKTNEGKYQVNIDTNIMHFQCFFEKKFWLEYIPKKESTKKPIEIEIYGNSCMQIDKISVPIIIEQVPEIDDEVIIHNVGAYSYSQAANFITKIPLIKIYE